jgi:hypothetical protein
VERAELLVSEQRFLALAALVEGVQQRRQLLTPPVLLVELQLAAMSMCLDKPALLHGHQPLPQTVQVLPALLLGSEEVEFPTSTQLQALALGTALAAAAPSLALVMRQQ